MMDWIKGRIKERTSFDGIALIAICGFIILFGGIAKLVAWAGLAWGIITMLKNVERRELSAFEQYQFQNPWKKTCLK